MKEYKITNLEKTLESIAISVNGGKDTGKISDGYHTFDELYEHRFALFMALCEMRANVMDVNGSPYYEDVWKSKLQSDGTMYEGWFIMGIGTRKGEQITYHLPLAKWDQCEFAETLDRAPEFDGHTSQDVLDRIAKL